MPRPAVALKLGRVTEVPLTIVRAEAGYGKSTALAGLAESFPGRCFWYNLALPDADPHVFVVHLVEAFRLVEPAVGDHALALLRQVGGALRHWAAALDALTNDLFDVFQADAVLVLDDYHLVDGPAVNPIVDRLMEHMPPTLHLVIGTRQVPGLAGLAKLRASGNVLDITRSDLAFTDSEVRALFERAGWTLNAEQVAEIMTATEGWPIAVQLASQRLRGNVGAVELAPLAGGLPEQLGGLFEYLAEEVLEAQPPPVQEFLLRSSALRRMDATTCDQVLGRRDSGELLRELADRSLFVTALDRGQYRYHPLVHEFLSKRARGSSPSDWRHLHRRAAAIYARRGEREEAIHHALEAGDHRRVAALLAAAADGMIQSGRYTTLGAWLDALPRSVLSARPELLRAQGDIARLTSRFDDALAAYRRARESFAAAGDREGESRALEGAALVFLDTVQPARAAPLLREALRLAGRDDRTRRRRLLLLTTENLTNRGHLERAERLERAIRRTGHASEADVDPRIYVRQGRLGEARRLVERALRSEERAAGRAIPRSHRENTAVLAWIAAFSGDAEGARAYAERALRRGRELRSPIVEVVALSRLGHGFLTGADSDVERALAFYDASLALAESLGVARFKVESLLGRVVAFGESGRFDRARDAAQEALAILDEAGDRYLAAIVWIALGAAAVRVRHPEASEWLEIGANLARRCGDRYGPTLAALWQAHLALHQADWGALDEPLGLALRGAEAYDLGCLFDAHPMLGLKSPGELEALLRAALRRGIEVRAARYFLSRLLPAPSGQASPTVPAALRIQALGAFRVWTDEREVPRSAWSRGKALELLQFLVTHAGRAVPREQVQEALWPDAAADASALRLRVALNALHRALEPTRPKGAEPRFVRREGSCLVLDDDLLWVDAQEFRVAVRRARELDGARRSEAALAAYRQALSLYRGDYLEEVPYTDWADEARRELAELYLRAAERTAELLIAQGAYREAEEVCEAVLRRDRTAEHAYALLMRAQHLLGDRALALRTFERCRLALREELGIEPSPGLVQLRAELARLPVGMPLELPLGPPRGQ